MPRAKTLGSKAGVLAFPELVPAEPEHPNAEPLRRLQEQLARWEKPALVLFSDSDPIFSTRNAERLAQLIPGAGELRVIEGGAHFLQEDKGEEIAAHVNDFIGEA